MKIVSIFAPYLYAIQYDNAEEDVYVSMMNNWRNATFRQEFYKQNLQSIQNNRYLNTIDVEAFHDKVYHFAIGLDKALESASKENNLNEYFDYLDLSQSNLKVYSKRKTKNNFIRIYSIKIGDIYVITGGAIKLTKRMQEHPLTNMELIKLEEVKNFLIDNLITDDDSFYDYLIEQDENDQ